MSLKTKKMIDEIMEDLMIEFEKIHINYLSENEEKEHVKQKGGKKGKLVKGNVKIIDVIVNNNDLELKNVNIAFKQNVWTFIRLHKIICFFIILYFLKIYNLYIYFY